MAQRLLDGRGWVYVRLLSDALLLLLAIAAARLGAPAAQLDLDGQIVLFVFPPLVILLLAVRGMYQDKLQVRIIDAVGPVLGATALAAMSIIAVAAFFDPSGGEAALMARAWVFGTVYVCAGRLVLAFTQLQARANHAVGKRTLIVGAGRIGAQVERRLSDQPDLGLRPVGYLDADPPPQEQVTGRRAPVLGPPSELARVAEETGAGHVILAFTSAPDSFLTPLVRTCEERGLEVSLVPRLFESINVRVALEHIGGLPLYGLRSVNPRGWKFAVKHALDRIGAAGLILALAPVLLAAAAAVKLSSPGPVLFRQRRVGRDGHEFEMYKFRTMRGSPESDGEADAAWAAETVSDGNGSTGSAVERRTRAGSFLRRYAIDELPQLLNVLKGDMSLVGPRPERQSYVWMFEQNVYRYGDRHRVKSGLTGWAQVHGLRGATSLADRVEWDNYYIENWSLTLDLKILFMTLVAVLRPSE